MGYGISGLLGKWLTVCDEPGVFFFLQPKNLQVNVNILEANGLRGTDFTEGIVIKDM